jgi:hypothetical protein
MNPTTTTMYTTTPTVVERIIPQLANPDNNMDMNIMRSTSTKPQNNMHDMHYKPSSTSLTDDFRYSSVILSRFRDNLYIALIGLGGDLLLAVLLALETLLLLIYGIPMKWEKHPPRVIWGECSLEPKAQGMSLLRKGAHLPGQPLEKGEWMKWVGVESMSARFTLRSLVPSLLIKCIWFAGSLSDMVTNLRSVCWGLGWHRYPRQWWMPAINRIFKRLSLFQLVQMKSIDQWVGEGKLLNKP